jgi:phage shock protein C
MSVKKVRKLERPKKGRIIGGVALGIANYFNLDVALVRIIWALLLLPGGLPGFIPYIICWILMPSEE